MMLDSVSGLGGGQVGLFGLYYAGLRGMKGKIIDALGQLGGQLMALYPEKSVYDIPGFPAAAARDFVMQLTRQATQFEEHEICLNERVLDIKNNEDGILTLRTAKGSHYSKSVVIAAGVGAFVPRKLDVPGVKALEGRGIYYHILNKGDFRGRKLMIVGGGKRRWTGRWSFQASQNAWFWCTSTIGSRLTRLTFVICHPNATRSTPSTR